MSDRKYYRHLGPLNTHSSTDYSTQFSNFEELNYQETKKNTSSWPTSEDTTRNPSRKIATKSSSSNIVKSQMKVQKSKNDLRIVRNRKRIELLSQPKFPVRNRVLKSSSMSAANTNNINANGKNEKLNVDVSSPATSGRFRAVTPRLLRLAKPKIHETSVYNFNLCSMDGAEKTEMAKTSKRIEELAEPKKLQIRTNKDPFKVNPKALKASCSTRVEELARPKGFSQPFPQLFQAYLTRAFIGS